MREYLDKKDSSIKKDESKTGAVRTAIIRYSTLRPPVNEISEDKISNLDLYNKARKEVPNEL